MIPPQFDYHAPGSLDEALALLGELDDAKVMSGGQSLLPMLKLRLASPANIVDIGRIPGLDAISEHGGFLRIGAPGDGIGARGGSGRRGAVSDPAGHRQGDRRPAGPEPRHHLRQPRHGDPANDHPATMLALRAHVVATGPGGQRSIGVDDFFHGLFTTALDPGEILTEIHIPSPGEQSGGAYLKLERKVGDYAVAGVAVHLTLDDGGKVTQAGVGLTNLGFAPIRASAAEEVLTGAALVEKGGLRGAVRKVRDAITRAPDADEVIAAAAQAAADATDPVADRRGSVEYKRNMARVLTGRAIRKALSRAGG